MRILLCPIGGRGFVYPMLGLGRQLSRRGDQVAFATSWDYASDIALCGFERIPRSAADGASFDLATWGHPLTIAIQVRHIQYAIERFGPQVIVASPLALGALIASELAELPLAVLGLATYLWPVPLPGGGRLSGDGEAAWRHDEMVAALNAARDLFRLPPHRNPLSESPLLGSVHLLQSVPELEPLASSLPHQVRLVGACLHEPQPPDAELCEWLEGGRGEPLAYVQPGSIFNGQSDFWPALLAGAGESGVRLAASLGRRRGGLGPPYPERFFVRGHTPQGPVLRRAQAVVASGNTTAVLGALTHGLPLLLLPSGGEQKALTARCVAAGAALALPPGACAAELGRGLRQVLEDASLGASARRLQAAFAAFDGPALAAQAVEELARATAGLGVA